MIFVDTSAWLALADRHDRNHAEAREFGRRLARGEFGRQVTTNYIMVETVTLARRRLGLETAMRLARTVAASGQVTTCWIEPVHHTEAMDLMGRHPDKLWSVADCTSFVVMRALAISSAFTFDRDFAQAGFTVLP